MDGGNLGFGWEKKSGKKLVEREKVREKREGVVEIR